MEVKNTCSEDWNHFFLVVSILAPQSSGSPEEDKKDKVSKGYVTEKITNPATLIETLNRYHVVFSELKDGKRDDNHVVKHAPVIKLDIDIGDVAILNDIKSKLADYMYVSVPSQSAEEGKEHIVVICDGEAHSTKAGYAIQVERFLTETGINPAHLDKRPLFGWSGYFAPASVGKLSPEEADKRSSYNHAKRYKLLDLEAHGIVVDDDNSSVRRGYLKVPEATDGVKTKVVHSTDRMHFLDPESTIPYFGSLVLVKDVVEAIRADNDTTKRYSGFGCPVCNKNHTMDPVKSNYGFAYLSYKGRDVIFQCTGNACADKPLSTMHQEKEKNIEVYAHNDKFTVILDGRIYRDLNTSHARMEWERAGHKPKHFVKSFIRVDDIVDRVDYLEPSGYKLEGRNLVITTNPSESWNLNIELDEEIINDFEHSIMDGMLRDLINLIALSLRFKENKLNKLLLTASSNKGKTALAKLLGFVETTASKFFDTLTGKEKWSVRSSDELKRSGLLLADDIVHDMPLGIKNVSDTIYIDVMYKGNLPHPMKFLLMTSTHDSLARTIDDELRNRILVMTIESDTKITDSEVYLKDSEKYAVHTEAYMKRLFMEALHSDATQKDLLDLQNKYTANRFDEHQELEDTIMSRVLEEVVKNDIQYITTYKGYYYTRKKIPFKRDIEFIVRDVLDLPNGKTTTEKVKKWVATVLKKLEVAEKRTSLNGNPNDKAYKINVKVEDDENTDFMD